LNGASADTLAGTNEADATEEEPLSLRDDRFERSF